MENNLKDYADNLNRILETTESIVVVTLTNVRGSAPQEIGARIIIGERGILFGTVGGGKVEAHCIKLAQEYLSSDEMNANYAFTWNLQKDIGMTCGGEVSFLFEVFKKQAAWNVAVFGAGHIAIELVKVLSNLNCKITVIDNRAEWLDKIIDAPKITKIHSQNMKDEVINLNDNCFVALMTMGHAHDVPILHEALSKRDFPYLGVIGSKAKRNRMEKDLLDMGLSCDLVTKFICPLGEDIGSNSPAEIALSIAAQLLRYRDL